jgi:hypothetical protein
MLKTNKKAIADYFTKKKGLTYLILLIFQFNYLTAQLRLEQNSVIDSLKNIINTSTNDRDIIKALFKWDDIESGWEIRQVVNIV